MLTFGLRILSGLLLSLLKCLDDCRIVQYAEELFDRLLLVRSIRLKVLSKNCLRLFQSVADDVVGTIHPAHDPTVQRT
jgi:hypothetical protein